MTRLLVVGDALLDVDVEGTAERLSPDAPVPVVLADRARHALDMLPGATALVVAGGVAANQGVRAALAGAAAQRGLPLVAPPIRLCTDNAVMVAWAGIERLRLGLTDEVGHAPRPRWPLEGMAA